jgi:hypothetical protein
MTTLIPKYSQVTTANRTIAEKFAEQLSPLDFGAVGDGVTDDTVALNAMFAAANGKSVDGLGLTYKVTPDIVIDPYATAGVGYGAGTKFFCIHNTNNIQNINIIGNVSFGKTYWGKHFSASNIFITGNVRFSSWYCNYTGINVSGITYFGSDLPPTTNFNGFYYNIFDACRFEAVVCDQRYGPVNLNSFRECHWSTWLVNNTGYVGYSAGFNPPASFHMNSMLACELFNYAGLVAPDGNTYGMVIEGVSGGINRIIGLYSETAAPGLYGTSWQIDNIHTSAAPDITFGAGQIAYNIPLGGEAAFNSMQRTLPYVYPIGNLAVGGDWSVLNGSGYPYCLVGSATGSVVTDAAEPTGLGKCVEFTAAAFQTVSVSLPSNITNNVVAYAIIYKITSGNPLLIAKDTDGTTDLFGTATITRLSDGWVLAYGKTFGALYFQAGAAFTLKISAVSAGRGNGVISPFTNMSKPITAYGTTTPSVATWKVGDIVYNTAPATAGYIGWVCTVAGTPGTWKPFGVIA